MAKKEKSSNGLMDLHIRNVSRDLVHQARTLALEQKITEREWVIKAIQERVRQQESVQNSRDAQSV
jgi:hypothetical protein